MTSKIAVPLYDLALEGLPLLGTPAGLAARYRDGAGSLQERAEDMALLHIGLSVSTGFVCGLGGFLTLPVTLPANIAGVALVQLHLCASTAALVDQDLADAAVRDRCVSCLTGAIAEGHRDVSQEAVDRSAVKIAERGLRLIAESSLAILESAGQMGAKWYLGRRLPRRSIPLIGGFIGGASDYYATRKVAAAARRTFLDPT